MNRIVVQPEQLDSLGEQMKQVAGKIEEVTHHLARCYQAIDWESRTKEQTAQQVALLMRQAQMLAEHAHALSAFLERKSKLFLEADNQGLDQLAKIRSRYIPIALSMLPATGAAGAEVLGASTSPSELLAKYQALYQSMPWDQKAETYRQINKEIAVLEEEVRGLNLEGMTRQIAEIDQQIEDAEKCILELEKAQKDKMDEAQMIWNQVLPGWTGKENDGDGVPWRTRADDLEEEARGIDQQIAAERAKREALKNSRADFEETVLNHQKSESRLADLRAQQQVLKGLFDSGVPGDGQTRKDLRTSERYGLAGCALYVAEKRDITSFGNGHPHSPCDWPEQAVDAGFEVGKTPVKGSIMTLQYGNKISPPAGGDGHTAIVESVTEENGVYKITVSEAGTIWENGHGVRAKHTAVTTRMITMPVSGADGVDFIYGKK